MFKIFWGRGCWFLLLIMGFLWWMWLRILWVWVIWLVYVVVGGIFVCWLLLRIFGVKLIFDFLSGRIVCSKNWWWLSKNWLSFKVSLLSWNLELSLVWLLYLWKKSRSLSDLCRGMWKFVRSCVLFNEIWDVILKIFRMLYDLLI